jgi:hypothetical protein
MQSRLPLLPSGPGGVCESTFHGPWQIRLHHKPRPVGAARSKSVQDIKDFRDGKQKEAKDLVQGGKSKTAYIAEMKKGNDEIGSNPVVRVIFWVKAIGIFSIVWIVAGLALAYRFGNGEG